VAKSGLHVAHATEKHNPTGLASAIFLPLRDHHLPPGNTEEAWARPRLSFNMNQGRRADFVKRFCT